jgi:antitoxin MazE
MKSKIQKWGNSYGVRIPMKIINKKGIVNGAEVEIDEKDDGISVSFIKPQPDSLEAMVNKIKPANLHREQDWGNTLGKEVW